MPFQICQNSCNNLNNSMCNQEKLKCANFFSYANNLQKNLCKTCAIRFLMSMAFKKIKTIKI